MKINNDNSKFNGGLESGPVNKYVCPFCGMKNIAGLNMGMTCKHFETVDYANNAIFNNSVITINTDTMREIITTTKLIYPTKE